MSDLVSDFQTLQYHIAAAPIDPPDPLDYHTEGWAAMRQCRIDGQYILNVAADTRVPQVQGNNHDEQAKAEWQLYDFWDPFNGMGKEADTVTAFTWMHMREGIKLRRYFYDKVLVSDGVDTEILC